MTDEKKQDFTRRISVANPTDMVVVIYDIALAYANDARCAIIENRNDDVVSVAVSGLRKSINELIASLNYKYSPSQEMLQLYRYCLRRLTAVINKRDIAALDSIDSILSKLRDAYSQIASTNTTGAIMQNSESVYAGLTYGRNSLNEDIVGTTNRGFLA